jgi:hypothetical protein
MEIIHTCEFDLLRTSVVREVKRHEWHETTPGRQRPHDLLPVLHGARRRGHRRLQVGHDDSPPKMPRAATENTTTRLPLRGITSNTRQAPSKQQRRLDKPVWQHSLEDAAFTNVEVPVVGARDDQLLLLLRRGCHGGRPQVREQRSAEADAARRGQPEEGGRRRLRVRVRADGGGGGGGGCGLHWVRSLYSIDLSALRWRARRGGAAGSRGLRERGAAARG